MKGDGWDSAREAYDRGARDQRAGKPDKANPYKGRTERDAWDEGFQDELLSEHLRNHDQALDAEETGS